jgi:hypothetical protein
LLPPEPEPRDIHAQNWSLENGINANLLFKWRQQWREARESCYYLPLRVLSYFL